MFRIIIVIIIIVYFVIAIFAFFFPSLVDAFRYQCRCLVALQFFQIILHFILSFKVRWHLITNGAYFTSTSFITSVSRSFERNTCFQCRFQLIKIRETKNIVCCRCRRNKYKHRKQKVVENTFSVDCKRATPWKYVKCMFIERMF